MKNKYFLVLIMLGPFFSFSQKHDGYFTLSAKMKKPPYAFVWLKPGSMAALQTEVTVDEYLAFLEAISKDSSSQYIEKLVPSAECALFPYVEKQNIGRSSIKTSDPLKFRKISWIDEEKFLKENNHSSTPKEKGIDDFYYNPYNLPITGISFEQAKEYCKWCTATLNKELNDQSKKNGHQAVIFRLPTPAEFREIENNGIENCTNKDKKMCEKNIKYLRNCKNEKGCALCNCSGKDTCAANKKIVAAFGESALLAAVSFNANWLGLYNVMGNASEMTSEKGIGKGGSYLQPAGESQPESVQNYNGPQKWLGLRLLAEVKDVDENIYFDENGFLIFELK